MFSVFFTDSPVTDFAGASRQDLPAYAAFFHAMLDRGVHLPPSAYEAWFLSSAHDERAVQTILDALPAAAGAGEQVGVVDPVVGERGPQGLGDVVLPDDLGEGVGPVATIEGERGLHS